MVAKTIGEKMEQNEKKIAEKACAIYAQLGKAAREAFVNQLEGMAFVLDSQRREKKPDDDKKEAS